MASELQYPTLDQVRHNTRLYEEKTILGFLETLKWLDNGAPEQFDGLKGRFRFNIQEVVRPDNREGQDYGCECGTVCCIGGAVNLYRANGDVWKAANLGLGSLETMDPALYGMFFPIGNRKPVTAARVLRHYLFTGKVNWDVKKGKVYNV